MSIYYLEEDFILIKTLIKKYDEDENEEIEEINCVLRYFLRKLMILTEYFKLHDNKYHEEIIDLYAKIKGIISKISTYEILTNDELTILKQIDFHIFEIIRSTFEYF